MRNKKVILILLLFLSSVNLRASILPTIPVIDVAGLVGKVALWVIEKEVGWTPQYNQFKEYLDTFNEYKDSFEDAYRGFKNISLLKDLLISVEDLEKLINIIYNDPQNMDSWFKIYTGKETIRGKYKNIENYDFVRKSSIYQRSPEVQKQIEKNIDNNKKELDKLQYMADSINQIRITEKGMLGEISKMQNEIKDFSIETKETPGEFFKLAVANASIRLKSLISDVNTLSMIRIMLEKDIQERIIEMDDILRNTREAASTAEANTK